MAIEVRHKDSHCDNYATVGCWQSGSSSELEIKIDFYDTTTRRITPLILDISTAIRLSKSIRTEINKAKEVDKNNPYNSSDTVVVYRDKKGGENG